MENSGVEAVRRILVVDDDEDIRELMAQQLRQAGHDVDTVGRIGDVRGTLREHDYALIVLDLNLPDGDGLALCRELRAEGQDIAIVMVTARDTAIDRVLGLELGADDYLTKPFEPRELLARVRNLLRRTTASAATGKGARIAHFGPWRLDLLQRRLIDPEDRLVILSTADFRLLGRLIETPHTPISREMLLPERRSTVAFDRSIDFQISRLRQKLATVAGGGELILTERSAGYLLACDVTYS